MRTANNANRWWVVLVAGVALAGVSCTNNSLDDSGGPNVTLQVSQLDTPQVSGNVNEGTCMMTGLPCLDNNNCAFGDVCNIPPNTGNCSISTWNATMENKPLSELATTSPFNDVTLTTLTIDYVWSPPVSVPPVTQVVIPLGVTIPVNSSGVIEFFPIGQSVITALGADPGIPAGTNPIVSAIPIL